jgi:hypothetical protein
MDDGLSRAEQEVVKWMKWKKAEEPDCSEDCQPPANDYYDPKVREYIRAGNNRKKVPRAKKDKRAKIAAASKRRNRK